MNSFIELYEEFRKLVENADEGMAKKFLTDNFSQFPQEVQDEIISAFFEEALSSTNEEEGVISDFQTKGLETVRMLERLKQSLEDKLQVLKLKGDIQNSSAGQ